MYLKCTKKQNIQYKQVKSHVMYLFLIFLFMFPVFFVQQKYALLSHRVSINQQIYTFITT